jgi:hypothetical protein
MRTAWMLLPISLAACGGSGGDATPPPPPPPTSQFTVAVAPTAVTLPAGGSASVAVTVSRSPGFSGPVLLELVGPAGGVGATFAPNPATGAQATLTLTAGPAAGTHGLYVKGSAGASKDAAALEVAVLPDPSLTVTGRVVDLFRQPLPGLEVRLGATARTTDAEGRFTFVGVTAPYDLVVKRVSPLEGHVFKGLTRPDPVLPLIGPAPAPARLAPVSGSLQGGDGFPLGPTVVTALFFSAPEGFGGQYLFPGQGPAYGPFSASWYGAASEPGTLHGLQWSVDAQLLPAQFLAYGSAPLAPTDGVAATGQLLPLQPAATGYLSGTVAVPAGFTLASKTLWLTAGPFSGVFLGTDGASGATFTYATPDVGLPVGLQATATRGGKSTTAYRAGLLPSQVIAIDLPAPPLLQAPAIGATGVTTGSTFAWTGFPGAIHVLFVIPASGPAFVVHLVGTSTTIPDLTAMGLPLAKGVAASWTVWGLGPFADLDAYAAPDRGLGLAGLDADASVGMAEPATFTTAP